GGRFVQSAWAKLLRIPRPLERAGAGDGSPGRRIRRKLGRMGESRGAKGARVLFPKFANICGTLHATRPGFDVVSFFSVDRCPLPGNATISISSGCGSQSRVTLAANGNKIHF